MYNKDSSNNDEKKGFTCDVYASYKSKGGSFELSRREDDGWSKTTVKALKNLYVVDIAYQYNSYESEYRSERFVSFYNPVVVYGKTSGTIFDTFQYSNGVWNGSKGKPFPFKKGANMLIFAITEQNELMQINTLGIVKHELQKNKDLKTIDFLSLVPQEQETIVGSEVKAKIKLLDVIPMQPQPIATEEQKVKAQQTVELLRPEILEKLLDKMQSAKDKQKVFEEAEQIGIQNKRFWEQMSDLLNY